MRVLSGIQPTGTPHLGNYFGAFVNWKKLQNDGHDCIYTIVNQHAITVPQKRDALSKSTLELGAMLLAVGLEKSIIFIQSDVPAHSQLTWILSSLASMGQMERMIQFKEKSEKAASASLGLFSYPVLQAADILLYKAELVPVGVDQAQHLELTRDLAKKFNSRYKEIFPEPKTLHTETTKVVGLDGKSKMSKSYNNYVSLVEEDDALWGKLGSAVTDPARVKKTDPGNPEICNIYGLHKLLSSKDDIEWARAGCTSANIGCIECKKKLYGHMKKLIEPIREEYNNWLKRPDDIRDILKKGGKKANEIAQSTLNEVYDLVGFTY